MGNIAVESGYTYDPHIVEGGTYANEVSETGMDGAPGFGIFQFTSGPNKQGLLDHAKSKGISTGTLDAQLEFVKTYTSPGGGEGWTHAWENAQQATDPGAAVDKFMNDYERPGIPHAEERVEAGKKIYEEMSGQTAPAGTDPTASGSTTPTTGTTPAGQQQPSGGGGIMGLIDKYIFKGLAAAFEKSGIGQALKSQYGIDINAMNLFGNAPVGGAVQTPPSAQTESVNGQPTGNVPANAGPVSGNAVEVMASKGITNEIISPYGMRNDPLNPGNNRMHSGVDLYYDNTPVYTPVSGIVDCASAPQGVDHGYGNLVIVKDTKDHYHAFGHLSQFTVQEGQQVKVGDQVGVSGNTGGSTGPHLHYGVHTSPSVTASDSIDPNTYEVGFGTKEEPSVSDFDDFEEMTEEVSSMDTEKMDDIAKNKMGFLGKGEDEYTSDLSVETPIVNNNNLELKAYMDNKLNGLDNRITKVEKYLAVSKDNVDSEVAKRDKELDRITKQRDEAKEQVEQIQTKSNKRIEEVSEKVEDKIEKVEEKVEEVKTIQTSPSDDENIRDLRARLQTVRSGGKWKVYTDPVTGQTRRVPLASEEEAYTDPITRQTKKVPLTGGTYEEDYMDLTSGGFNPIERDKRKKRPLIQLGGKSNLDVGGWLGRVINTGVEFIGNLFGKKKKEETKVNDIDTNRPDESKSPIKTEKEMIDDRYRRDENGNYVHYEGMEENIYDPDKDDGVYKEDKFRVQKEWIDENITEPILVPKDQYQGEITEDTEIVKVEEEQEPEEEEPVEEKTEETTNDMQTSITDNRPDKSKAIVKENKKQEVTRVEEEQEPEEEEEPEVKTEPKENKPDETRSIIQESEKEEIPIYRRRRKKDNVLTQVIKNIFPGMNIREDEYIEEEETPVKKTTTKKHDTMSNRPDKSKSLIKEEKKEEEVVEYNGHKYRKNDVDYLISENYSKDDALKFLEEEKAWIKDDEEPEEEEETVVEGTNKEQEDVETDKDLSDDENIKDLRSRLKTVRHGGRWKVYTDPVTGQTRKVPLASDTYEEEDYMDLTSGGFNPIERDKRRNKKRSIIMNDQEMPTLDIGGWLGRIINTGVEFVDNLFSKKKKKKKIVKDNEVPDIPDNKANKDKAIVKEDKPKEEDIIDEEMEDEDGVPDLPDNKPDEDEAIVKDERFEQDEYGNYIHYDGIKDNIYNPETDDKSVKALKLKKQREWIEEYIPDEFGNTIVRSHKVSDEAKEQISEVEKGAEEEEKLTSEEVKESESVANIIEKEEENRTRPVELPKHPYIKTDEERIEEKKREAIINGEGYEYHYNKPKGKLEAVEEADDSNFDKLLAVLTTIAENTSKLVELASGQESGNTTNNNITMNANAMSINNTRGNHVKDETKNISAMNVRNMLIGLVRGNGTNRN